LNVCATVMLLISIVREKVSVRSKQVQTITGLDAVITFDLTKIRGKVRLRTGPDYFQFGLKLNF
jgi:hypothetical protein